MSTTLHGTRVPFETDSLINADQLRLVAYIRVSTDRQAESGMGLAVQHDAINSWAAANGHTIVATLRDESISGSTDVMLWAHPRSHRFLAPDRNG